MALSVMVDGGMLPAIAAVRSSAALISASAGVSVGMVKYLCLKKTELQVRVLLVLVM